MRLSPRYDGPSILVFDGPADDQFEPVSRQRRRMEALLADLDDDGWASPTRCDGWTVQDVIAHLVTVNAFWEASVRAGLDGAPTRMLATFDPAAHPARMVDGMRALSPHEIFDQFVASNDGFIAVLVKLIRGVSPQLQQGAFVVYKFFSTAVTYPLLFAIGVSMTPWDKLVAAFNVPYLVTIVATVTTLMATGFFVGRRLGLYPIEAAIVNACHSGQGGTGDVAILTAANRMQLMPFAQIATRIGGAITVTLTLIILAQVV